MADRVTRRVCVVVGSRANYASIRSVMRAVQEHPELELQLVVTASALLDRYGSVVDTMVADGFTPQARVHMLLEGESPVTMAKSTGLGLHELPTVFDALSPDVVVSVGDRFETMATVLAATYMNIPLAHTMGGEVSGSIDESIRHAVTKFAHLHFPASADAAERIRRMGEQPERVHLVGCPRIDLTAEVLGEADTRMDGAAWREVFGSGVGPGIDVDAPFVLVSQHPVTTEYDAAEAQMTTTLEALRVVGLPVVMLWPNSDAGSDGISRAIRKSRERGETMPLHLFKNLRPEVYLPLMARTACLVGNSSSALREGAYIGTPAVNVGSRQRDRERGSNVIDAPHEVEALVAAIRDRIAHGRFPSDPLYGDGTAGRQVAEVLASCAFDLDKRMTY